MQHESTQNDGSGRDVSKSRDFDGSRPPDGLKFESGLYEVRVIDNLWREAQGQPRGMAFNPKARYRRKETPHE